MSLMAIIDGSTHGAVTHLGVWLWCVIWIDYNNDYDSLRGASCRGERAYRSSHFKIVDTEGLSVLGKVNRAGAHHHPSGM